MKEENRKNDGKIEGRKTEKTEQGKGGKGEGKIKVEIKGIKKEGREGEGKEGREGKEEILEKGEKEEAEEKEKILEKRKGGEGEEEKREEEEKEKAIEEKERIKPKTKLGRAVLNGEITNIDDILLKRKPIKEAWIVDYFLPDLKSETIELRTTQRVTDSGRKISYRAVVIVGSEKGYVGLGSGKASEPNIALSKALDRAKKNIIKVKKYCGSWECQCNAEHSIGKKVEGKESSTYVVLKPAPKGIGLAVNDTIKAVLRIAGIKDVWGKTRGASDNVYNVMLATIKALDKLNEINE